MYQRTFQKASALMIVTLAAMLLVSLAACDRKPAEGFSSDSICIVYDGNTYKAGEKAQKLLKAR